MKQFRINYMLFNTACYRDIMAANAEAARAKFNNLSGAYLAQNIRVENCTDNLLCGQGEKSVSDHREAVQATPYVPYATPDMVFGDILNHQYDYLDN